MHKVGSVNPILFFYSANTLWKSESQSSNCFIIHSFEIYFLVPGQQSTYVSTGDTYDWLVRKHICDLKYWNIGIPPVVEELPTVYWMPNLHKNPYGSRFIAVSNKCTTKPLSSLLTTCLTALFVHFEIYCAGICRNTGINCF